MEARFRVRDSLHITGRGTALTGDVVDGIVRIGMRVVVPGWREPLVVSAVEFVDWKVGAGGEASVALLFRDAPALEELRELCAPGMELLVRTQTADDSAIKCHRRIRRFWFPMTEGFGIGVTETSEAEARALAEEARTQYYPKAEFVGTVADVDVSTLDPAHVLPNIGPPAVRGVWYPRLNL